MKQAVWIAVVLLIVGGLAWPKVKPMLAASTTATADKVADAKAADKGESGGGKKKKSEGGESGKSSGPLKVNTFIVKPMPFAETVSATGTLRADEGVELQAEISGKVMRINFEEGKEVKKGALLVKINDEELQANLRRYLEAKKLAVLQEQRYAKLLQQKVITQNDYDTAASNVQTQQAFIDLYKAQIDKTEIRAPFDGVVGLRYVSLGAYINATGATTTRIATLQRLDKLKVDFSVPEKYTGRVRVGSPITFSVAGGLQKFTGEIYAIDPRIDSSTRTLVLRAVCPNSDGRLLPGSFANVTVSMDEIPDAVMIPSEAVIAGLDEKNVFVMKDGKAERRTVQTGSRTATLVHILNGLDVGDVVITSGLQTMRQGQEVAANHEGGSPSGSSKKEGASDTAAHSPATAAKDEHAAKSSSDKGHA